MKNSEKITTLKENSIFKLKIKGSQFIGYGYHIETSEEAINKLNDLKKEFYNATHHCYCYRIKNGDEKYSDDGEPNGTAGIRIQNALNHFQITDVLVVVVRYFGGTKLGVGPLGKAYSETALSLLENSQKNELTKFINVSFEFNYENVSIVHYLIKKYKCKKIANNYFEKPTINFYIEPFQFDPLSVEINNLTSGKVFLNNLNQELYF